jgi:hypothetical protein
VNDPQLRHNPSPTQFLELNQLLRELTDRAAEILGDNFVGRTCRAPSRSATLTCTVTATS